MPNLDVVRAESALFHTGLFQLIVPALMPLWVSNFFITKVIHIAMRFCEGSLQGWGGYQGPAVPQPDSSQNPYQ